jgi:hypothetical protein
MRWPSQCYLGLTGEIVMWGSAAREDFGYLGAEASHLRRCLSNDKLLKL